MVERTLRDSELLVTRLRLRGAKVSSKSVILSSDGSLSLLIQQGLSKRGINLKVEQVARDLGVDATVATRRRVTTAKARFAKGLARAGVIKNLLKSNSKAARLINTGAKPQLTWGHQGKGMAPTTVRRLKAGLVFFGASEVWWVYHYSPAVWRGASGRP